MITTEENIQESTLEQLYSKSTSLQHRKKFAQFFTPLPIALLMSQWLLGNKNLNSVLEPAFGLGVFSRLLLLVKKNIEIKGFEIDEKIFQEAGEIFNSQSNVKLYLEDYILSDWDSRFDGIICNPPFFKFHDYDNKSFLWEFEQRLGCKLSGFTNLYTLFLLKSISQLRQNGRAAYIIPSEFLNSDYGKLVKAHLVKSNTLRYIIVIDFEENVFQDVLTTACIVLCANDGMERKVQFHNVAKVSDLESIEDLICNYPEVQMDRNSYSAKELDPEIKWSKYYREQNSSKFKNLVPFSSVAKVVRGIATGANEYFTFSESKAKQYGIENEFLLPCITKANDAKTAFFTSEEFNKLKSQDYSIYLFNAIGELSENARRYLEKGEEEGVHKKYLTSNRNPWYSLENRATAPIWVSVFNRTGLRFIRNEAGIANLTTFHCVYPINSSNSSTINIDLLFAYLLTDVAKLIFEDNSREYGNGLQKFEPNDICKGSMLDLRLVDSEKENEILVLYSAYRGSVLNGLPNPKYIESINNLFVKGFTK